MCGICGIVHGNPMAPVDPARLAAMCDTLLHRGPDDDGTLTADNVMLCSRRLSIVDLSANGHMPMTTLDGRYSIVYNGEVYNYRQLRASLAAKGYKFRSNTDTEVLLYLYVEEGASMLHWLNGMFALAIWDFQDRSLFLARDRLGVKPLYFHATGDTLYFASEQKALFAAGVLPEFDTATWRELLCFRYTAGERTPFRGIRRLPPGHHLLWRGGKLEIKRWWNLGDRVRELREASPKDPAEWLRQTFDDAVNLRRICDVPVGVLLSGGLDSSSVVASLAAQGVTDVATFTVRFKEAYYDESPLARNLARRVGMEYHDLVVGERELLDLVHQSTWLNDEPLAHANDPHLLAISRYAKRRVTVLLSGEGADEIMGGYVRYRALKLMEWLRWTRPLAGTMARWLSASPAGTFSGRVQKLQRMLLLDGPEEFVLFNACDVLPSELAVLGIESSEDEFASRRHMLAEAAALYPNEPVRQAMYLDQQTFLVSILDRNDRTTMGASIECRVPFLDYRLVEGLAALRSEVLFRGNQSKALMREALGQRLPREILKYRKWGFAVPWQEYFQKLPDFRELVASLPDLPLIKDGPFDRSAVKRVINGRLAGDLQHHALVRQLFFIAIWHKVCVADVRPGFRADWPVRAGDSRFATAVADKRADSR